MAAASRAAPTSSTDADGSWLRARLQLEAQRRRQRRRRLATQHDALAVAPQPVERCGRLFAGAGGIGELLFGPLTFGDEGCDPFVERVPLGGGLGTACVCLAPSLGEADKVERCDRCLQPGNLEPELLGALGGGGLERERPQPLAHLVLEVARALDLNGNARQLQLRTVATALEAAEPGRLLDQLAPFLWLRVEHGLDPPLADHRAQSASEADVGEQFDEVDAAHRRLVDEVLPLPAALQLPRDRHLGVREIRPRTVGVVEQQVDLAEIDRPPSDRAREEDIVGLLGAQFARAHRACGPEDRVGDVRLPGPVRADDDRDSRLETDLHRLDERLEATELDCLQMHARGGYRSWRMGVPIGPGYPSSGAG